MAVINKDVIILTNASDKTLTFRNIYVKPYIQPKETFPINKNDSIKKVKKYNALIRKTYKIFSEKI